MSERCNVAVSRRVARNRATSISVMSVPLHLSIMGILCVTQLVLGSLPLDIDPEDIRGVVEALGGGPPRRTKVRYEPAPRLPEDLAPSRNFYKGCELNSQERRYIHFHCVDALPHLNGVLLNVTKLYVYLYTFSLDSTNDDI